MEKLMETLKQIFGKSGAQTVMTIIGTVWVTIWIGLRVRDVELAIHNKFLAVNDRISQVEKQLDLTWSIHMQVARDRIVAQWNPTHKFPDSWRIYHDVKAGREPIGVRIGAE